MPETVVHYVPPVIVDRRKPLPELIDGWTHDPAAVTCPVCRARLEETTDA